MAKYNGKSVFKGVAIGKIHVYKKTEQQVKRVKIDDPSAEMVRYEAAKNEAIEQLGSLYEKAVKEVGEANAMIFMIHQEMLDEFDEPVEEMVNQQEVNVEFAIANTADNFAEMFLATGDEVIMERAADVRDISERLITNLMGGGGHGVNGPEPAIILAEDLAPSETVQMEKDKVLSFVTVKGSINSHTAILARTMAIPALVSTDIDVDIAELHGKMGVVDGATGEFYVDPDEETMEMLQKKKEEDMAQKALLQQLKGRETITLDGKKLKLYANIGNVKDLATVLENDAGGIGLFRSEFIYLDSDDFPSEETQFQIYKKVAETMGKKQVIIRTLDIGADKQCDYFNMEHEENPALGYRAIRICLTQTDIFKTQLRALFRASAFGNIAIMYPMIISVAEVKRIKEIVNLVKAELIAEGIAIGNPQQGIMIETPAAAIVSDELAKEVDFFSIGTNDLTQYTLAIDRQNAKLDAFYDGHHPAVLRLIQLVADNAHKAGIWAGICGELGADQSLTKDFLAMGLDELSVSPGSVLPIRKIVLETNVEEYSKEAPNYRF